MTTTAAPTDSRASWATRCAAGRGVTASHAMAKKKEPLAGTNAPRVFAARPTKAEALSVVKEFFDLLREGEVETAGGIIAHHSKDWWPHQVRAMWQDLAGPWLEDQGEDFDLDDDTSWRDFGWLGRIGVDLETSWDGDDDSFFVNVEYDGIVTDVSANFTLVARDGGWVLQRTIIHVA